MIIICFGQLIFYKVIGYNHYFLSAANSYVIIILFGQVICYDYNLF